ncbi:MAG: hypothetical protein QM610_07495 [Chitinophagaceae bacterium]
MKRVFPAIAIAILLMFGMKAQSQVSISVNIGSQPLWGPTGYDHVDYYYLPDIEMYYYVPSGQYIYYHNGRWVWVSTLPAAYRNFDFYNSYKVVLNSPRPYLNHKHNVAQYGKFKNNRSRQEVIRDSRDTKYNVVKGHDNYNGGKNQPGASQQKAGNGKRTTNPGKQKQQPKNDHGQPRR